MTITTNHQHREIVSFFDLIHTMSETEIASFKDQFDYISFETGDDWSEEAFSERFVKAYGSWHDIEDVQLIESSLNPTGMHHPFSFVVDPDHELHGWTAISTESHGSGIVFKIVLDTDGWEDHRCIVGYWTGQ